MTEGLIPRFAERQLREALDEARVIVVNGPRQSGKSTLLDLVAASFDRQRVSLDEATNLKSARTDPTGFVTAFGDPLFIDEVQRGGDRLVLALKAEVDRRHRDVGLFVLAGSSRFLTVPTLSESLAGRVRIIDLWPLSQAELEGVVPRLLDAAFDAPTAVRDLEPRSCARAELMQRIVLGGFPAVHRLGTTRARASWFDDYARTLVLRDLTELSRIRQAGDLPRLVRLIAARSAQELNVADLARDASLNSETLRNYLALLETIYLHYTIPAWSSNTTSRVVRRPKIHMVDSGMAANFVGASADSLTKLGAPHVGALVETFVAGEIARLRPTSNRRIDMYHYRQLDGREVDLVLEDRTGAVVGIEVKAAQSVDDGDVRHLIRLRDDLGDRFCNGILLHLGDRPIPFGDRITALPISALWS